MKIWILFSGLLWACCAFAQPKATALRQVSAGVASARTCLFDLDWRISPDSAAGAQRPDYDDSRWRRIDLPHDWSIEDLPNQGAEGIAGPFAKASPGATSTGYAVGGTRWYRKRFRLQPAERGKTVAILFDGVYMNADVWLNGHHLGNHPYGYTPFQYNLTPYLRPVGQENVVAVRVRNEGKNTRWYTGSGIYRHVWLAVTEPVHVAPWGVSITTTQGTGGAAQVQVTTTLDAARKPATPIILQTILLTPDGRIVGQSRQPTTVTTTQSTGIQQTVTLPAPTLWSPETPYLYRAKVAVLIGKRQVDSVEVPFGVRYIRFDAQEGFTLNGKRVLLKGGCVHHDNGPLGAVAIDRAEERKVELLKANGFNAVRSSHNPPSTAFLDACDRLGMLVIDEAFDMWRLPKKPDDYHRFFDAWWQRDLQAMIRRDRNHPSVILWSIGNEIAERADSSGLAITRRMVDEAHRLDPSRPVMEAICGFWERPGTPWSASAKAFALLDVGGYNYEWKRYESDHLQAPNRIMVGSETFAREAFENWRQVETHPYVIGDFVWTAMDYIGETAIGHSLLQPKGDKDSTRAVLPWPWFNAYCGDLDLTGFKKPQSYYRDVVWRNRPIAMAVHSPIPDGLKETVTNWGWPDERQSWTWPGAEGKPLEVRVFSRSSGVRLELNGKVIGERKLSDSSIVASFTVPYQPGQLKAVSLENGLETGTVELATAGPAHALRLSPDRAAIRASRNDLSFVTVEVVDAHGQVVPDVAIPVSFQVSGKGELAAVGNANPTDMASFQQPKRTTFRGRCLAVIRPQTTSGTITLTATAAGLQPAEVVIRTR
ncbi:DUF4982 domain-containing protein [Spirosoma taeanense]|uniref:DUF4982 domain-containing protein n=1 Tax=Spirosoma taeanense TaxID=2735870 RepID=A0A6M5YAK4_9BACT|nr:glycoside hydrolase family 2 TIM barrel-domain containing protein [Spirosoma taeanense]QJW89882.1 DUF4982 domain-containing protein [Spirosoma taeanense]